MDSTVDVRDTDRAQRRERVFDRLDDVDVDDTVTVTADRDVHPTLSQYEITRDAALDRAYERTGPDVWEIRVTKRPLAEANDPYAFDVRNLPPRRRHTVLTDTFELLDVGEAFVLVNDHDPEPLYHELRSTHGDVVGWSYEHEGDGEWRVEISKTGTSAARVDDGATATFDVRDIPKPDRHPTIHHRYGNLAAGESLDIVAPHEPNPLRREFRQQYGGDFEWDVRERDPGEVRVRITKAASDDATDTDDVTDESDATGNIDTDDLTVVQELDVRDRPPAQRHEAIFDAYAHLDAGEAFVLVNDHDPKPLYHQFEAEAGPEFRWEYRARDPGEFRVLVGRDASDDPQSSPPEDVEAPF
ncbi:DUF2249 domain-containing protein [Halobacterium sp. KA-4]|uniref:DUF2249 domain-containing protein n=1 Tax=Halobacterium sp. KA-4 TaxID=2896367 RepID=UPI001E4220E9|nr:DUF2249 domain-containing protein [Halobacterium sp. KA-4]MCD2199601.1 DUF2249 domain-containing protein [Halobacterium sp. KA-4]